MIIKTLHRIIKVLLLSTLILLVVSCEMENIDPPVSTFSCDETPCQNGGICVDGICECPTHFSGDDCSRQDPPKRVNLTEVEVVSFRPLNQQGGSWDLNDGADIYVELSLSFGSLPPSWTSQVISNADPNIHHHFLLTPPYYWLVQADTYFMAYAQEWRIKLYDADVNDEDDYMGFLLFTPYTRVDGYPNELYLDNGFDLEMILHLEYIF